MSYSLMDGEQRAAAHPDTFHIPTRKSREGLQLGDYAKLVFIKHEGTERMWVRVTVRLPDGRYRGILDNHPVYGPPGYGALVEFEPKHIIGVIKSAAPRDALPKQLNLDFP